MWRNGPENLSLEWESDPESDLLWDATKLLDGNTLLALAELKALADKGSALSMMYLGDTYLNGRGVTQDVEKGEKWMRRAAERGSIEGAQRLAVFYKKRGDFNRAREEFMKLDDRYFSHAMYLLGHMHYFGQVVDKYVEKSIYYWRRAEENCHLLAKNWYSYLLRNEKFGIIAKIKGYAKLFTLLISGVRCKIMHTDSDRLRDWW